MSIEFTIKRSEDKQLMCKHITITGSTSAYGHVDYRAVAQEPKIEVELMRDLQARIKNDFDESVMKQYGITRKELAKAIAYITSQKVVSK